MGAKIMFKEMVEAMSDEEVKRCMTILVDGSIVLSITRNMQQNSITVIFRIVGYDRNREFRAVLLPDEIHGLDEDVRLRADGKYLYEQYMIAKGYSEYWKGNMFV